MSAVLPQSFFKQPTLVVARTLLGKTLVRRIGRRIRADVITDVEAYDGPRDRASHAARGLTKRNTPMFGSGGSWYIYFTYGMHWLLNIVTGPPGYPAAILIRGLSRTSGPARVTRFLGINADQARALNNLPATRKTGLWIEDKGIVIPPRLIRRGPRIGIGYAGRVWSKKPYRFFIRPESVWKPLAVLKKV